MVPEQSSFFIKLHRIGLWKLFRQQKTVGLVDTCTIKGKPGEERERPRGVQGDVYIMRQPCPNLVPWTSVHRESLAKIKKAKSYNIGSKWTRLSFQVFVDCVLNCVDILMSVDLWSSKVKIERVELLAVLPHPQEHGTVACLLGTAACAKHSQESGQEWGSWKADAVQT